LACRSFHGSFPAELAGRGYVTHLRGPFPGIAVVRSGGANLDDARAWARAGAAVGVGLPLLGGALRGGNLDRPRWRCRALRADARCGMRP
jgi:2-dehydro-3-deoxyphosphogluconate aldolase / (4S)-4-hydroxy-2-oxoglutarate aldolase